MDRLLTLVVCTRNRDFILSECLDSLFHQSACGSKYTVLVIDNASTDSTNALVERYREQYPNCRYHYLSEIGLSHARNEGWKYSDTLWVGYIDDDARVPYDFVERALRHVRSGRFDCFGGTYYAWYRYGRPAWLPEGFGDKPAIETQENRLVPEGEFLSGGVFFCRRELLEHSGGFNTALGMTDRIGYGEEDELQLRLRRQGKRIGYDPELFIEHCVMPHKFRVGWHLRRIYEMGKASKRLNATYKMPFLWFVRVVFTSIFVKLPYNLVRLLIDPDYYLANLVLDVCKYPLIWWGRVKS